MLNKFLTLTFSQFIAFTLFTLTIFFIVEAQQYEGNTCFMKDHSFGVCKALKTCQWFINGRKTNTLKPGDIKRCSFIGKEEIICCGDERPATPSPVKKPIQVADGIVFGLDEEETDDTVIVDRTSAQRTSKLACEKYTVFANIKNTGLDFHILNGNETLLGEFPHMAAIGYISQEVGKNITWDCGGSLISERYVLTAAHCVSDKTRPPFMIRMGKVTLDTDGDDAIPQDFGVQEFKMHPQYSAREKYNDIALIKMKGKPVFDDKVRPACITFDETTLGDAAPVIVTGFGVTDFSTQEKSNSLLKTNIQIVEAKKCNQTLADNNKFTTRVLKNGLNGGQMCAYDPLALSDTCQGDSGGPLQVKVGNISYVVGITSFGDGCGSAIPSIYVRVSFYLTWIESIIWPNGVNNE